MQLPKLFLQLSIEGTNYLLNTDLKVPIDAFGYYIGYFIGMLVDIIISAIFTGGAKTVADVLKIISKQFTEIYKFAKSTLKYTSKVATNSIEYTIDLLAKLRNGAKNIKPFLDEILEFLRTFLGALPKQLTEYFTKFGITIQKVPQQVLYSGIPTKVGDDIYALIKNGKEIFRGTKKEIDDLAEKLKKMSDKEAKKYLDDLVNKVEKIILGKYSKRSFDINNCGGKILNLSWKNAKITKEGIEVVKKHLSRFEEITANKKMIERLEKIEKGEIPITDWDKRFYTHEMREYERYKNLGFENTKNDLIPDEVFNNAHSATLEDYKIYELDKNGKRELYYPEVNEVDFLSEDEKLILGL